MNLGIVPQGGIFNVGMIMIIVEYRKREDTHL